MSDPNLKAANHYELLGVRPTASPQQVRQAFRELSKLYHPDTTALPAAEATDKFQQINEAYAVLSSPDRRWTYDKQIGYSRISVMQPMEALYRSSDIPQRKAASNIYLDPTDRPLSAGEIFALFILGLTFVACLALVVTVGLTRPGYIADSALPLVPQVTESSLPQAVSPSLAQPELEEAVTPELVTPRVSPSAPPLTSRPLAPGSVDSQFPRWL